MLLILNAHLADDNGIALAYKCVVQLLYGAVNVVLLTPVVVIFNCVFAPLSLCCCHVLVDSKVIGVIVVNGYHKPVAVCLAAAVGGNNKAVVACSVFNVGVPAGNKQPALFVVGAGLSYGVNKDLIVGVDILIADCIGLSVGVVGLLVHGLENKVLVIILEAVSDLRPDLFILVLYLVLVVVNAAEPALVNGIVAVAVNVDDSVKVVAYHIINNFLNSVKPCAVDGIIGCSADLIQI